MSADNRIGPYTALGELARGGQGIVLEARHDSGQAAVLKILLVNIGRFAQDLQQWTGFETGHLQLPDSWVQISSIMPQKRNPVPIEHLRHLASATVGRCDLVVNTMHNTPFTDMNDSEGEVQQAGYAAFESGAFCASSASLRWLVGVAWDGDAGGRSV